MVGTATVSTLDRHDGRVVSVLNEDWTEDVASKSLSTDELAFADIQDAHQRIEHLEKMIQHLEKMLADKQAKRTRAESVEMEELAFMHSKLEKGVQCSAVRDTRSKDSANCTIIKVHECSEEDKYNTEYDILFEDCTQPVRFPLKRMSLHRMPLMVESADYYDSKKACKALLAQIDDATEGDAEVTEEA